MMTPTIKRYFTTDKLVTKLPFDFVHSKHPNRSVHVISCTLFQDPDVNSKIMKFYSPQYATLHTNFIHVDKHLDSFCCFCNVFYPKRKKYQQFIAYDELIIWFKNYDKSPIDISKCYFVLELMLEF